MSNETRSIPSAKSKAVVKQGVARTSSVMSLALCYYYYYCCCCCCCCNKWDHTAKTHVDKTNKQTKNMRTETLHAACITTMRANFVLDAGKPRACRNHFIDIYSVRVARGGRGEIDSPFSDTVGCTCWMK